MLSIYFEPIDRSEPQLLAIGGFFNASCLLLKESHFQTEHGSLASLYQALGLRAPRVRSVLLAVSTGDKHAKLPAHLIFSRRAPVRIQQITLVQHGIGNFLDQVELHPFACNRTYVTLRSVGEWRFSRIFPLPR